MLKKNKLKTRKRIWIRGIFLGALFGVGLYFGANYFLYRKAGKILESLEEKYRVQITYKQLECRLSGLVRIDSIRFHSTSDSIFSGKVQGSAEAIVLRGIHWWSLIWQHHLQVEELELTSPSLTLWKTPDSLKVNDYSKGGSGFPGSSSADRLILSGGRFILLSVPKGDTILFTASTEMNIQELTVALQHEDYPINAAGGIIETGSFFWNLRNMPRYLSWEKMHFDIGHGDLKLDSVTLRDRSSMQTCMRELRPYIRFQLSQFTMEGLSGLSDLTGKQIIADQARLTGGNLFVREIVRDHSVRKRLPQEVLRELALGILIDSVEVRNGNVTFSHYFPETQEVGSISFSAVDADIGHLTNMEGEINGDSLMRADVKCRFMGQAPLRVYFSFDLSDSLDAHYCKGHLGRMDLREINEMSVPASSIRVERGICEGLDFTIWSNRYESEGDLAFAYQDLHVEMLKKGSNTEKGLVSFFMNIFFIPGSNLSSDKDFSRGEIETTRDPNRSIFRHWWMSIRSGLLDTLL